MSSARTRRGAARSCSIVVAAFRASPVLTTGAAGPIESATVAGRGTSAEPERAAIDGRAGTAGDEPHGVVRHLRVGVTRRIAESPVDPVGQGRRAHGAKPVRQLERRAVRHADAREHPADRPGVERFVERRPDAWPGAEGPAGGRELSVGRDEADRLGNPTRRGLLDRLARLRLAHPSDVYAADRRAARDRPALRQGDRAERTSDHADEDDDGEHDEQPAAQAPARPVRDRDERAGHER